MTILAGAHLVLPDRLVSPGSLVLEGPRIGRVEPRTIGAGEGGPAVVDLRDHYILPGFIDAHVHGLAGRDALEDGAAVADLAAGLPARGVVAFAPTAMACPPATLRRFLTSVGAARAGPAPRAARVLPAHLESGFINPEYAGAQPVACLRLPPLRRAGGWTDPQASPGFGGTDLLRAIEDHRADIGIVTLAPELPGGIDLVRHLAGLGVQVSLGHSAASYEEARAAMAAGARRVTHLFNRMPPPHHRAPGLAGAALESDDVAAEIIVDAIHVHPAMVRAAIAAKQPARVLAITDGTAGSGLPDGSTATLGGRTIRVDGRAARLDDGTLAGSVTTMDAVYRTLVTQVGLSLSDAALVCATTPARELGLYGHGVIAAGATADLVVLDARFEVAQTWIGGQLAWSRPPR